MKQFFKLRFLFVLCMVLSLTLVHPFAVYADLNDLIIASSSNALMTLELDDDYSVMPMSSMGTVTNTINSSGLDVLISYKNLSSGNSYEQVKQVTKSNNRYNFSTSVPEGYAVTQVKILLERDDLPSPGYYRFGFDYTSDFAYDYRSADVWCVQHFANASSSSKSLGISSKFQFYSGDVYVSPFTINLSNLYQYQIYFNINASENVRFVGGSFAIRFEKTSADSSAPSTGLDTSAEDYQADVSGSLSDLSSSVDTMTEEISGVTEAIQNLQGAMEPHYSNVLTQLHHITEQLHAFYDQVYNNIHLAQMNLLGQIKEAIENIDLEVNISLDGLKQTIQQVGQNVITNDNKISADQIANDEANTEEVKDAVKEHGNFIIDGLKGLFIPSDEFFKAYFDDLYAYFSDRFGFLSFPIDLLVRTVNLFINSSDVDAVLTLPSFEISGVQVWADQSFNFTEFLETNFAFLLAAIRTVTSIGMIYAFVNLCQDKWDEVMKS